MTGTSTEGLSARADARLTRRFEDAARLAALDPARRRYYRDLVAMRLARAREAEFPAYHVLTDRQLLAVCELFPETAEEIEVLSGLSPRKRTAWGAEILALAQAARRAGAPAGEGQKIGV